MFKIDNDLKVLFAILLFVLLMFTFVVFLAKRVQHDPDVISSQIKEMSKSCIEQNGTFSIRFSAGDINNVEWECSYRGSN